MSTGPYNDPLFNQLVGPQANESPAVVLQEKVVAQTREALVTAKQMAEQAQDLVERLEEQSAAEQARLAEMKGAPWGGAH